jgi:hypothetical protein
MDQPFNPFDISSTKNHNSNLMKKIQVTSWASVDVFAL